MVGTMQAATLCCPLRSKLLHMSRVILYASIVPLTSFRTTCLMSSMVQTANYFSQALNHLRDRAVRCAPTLLRTDELVLRLLYPRLSAEEAALFW